MIHFRTQSIKEGIEREYAVEKCMENEKYFIVRFSEYNTGLTYIISEGNDQGIEVELKGDSPLRIKPIYRDYTYSSHFRMLYPKGYTDNYDLEHGDYSIYDILWW